jgi:hypothetical protein
MSFSSAFPHFKSNKNSVPQKLQGYFSEIFNANGVTALFKERNAAVG